MKRFLVILLSLVISSCSIGIYNYPRTIGKDKLQLNVGYFVPIRDRYSFLLDERTISVVGYPELVIRYGLEDNVDVGIRMFGLGFLSDIKYQFLGDKESFLASSFDLEFGATFIPFPITYSLVNPSMIFVLGPSILFDVMWVRGFSTYFGLKSRFTYSIFYNYGFPIPDDVKLSSFGFMIIGTFGVSILSDYNYGVNLELNFMKSLLSDAWSIAPGMYVRIRF